MNLPELCYELSEQELIAFVYECIKMRTTLFSFIKCFPNKDDQKEFIKHWFQYMRKSYNQIDSCIILSSGKIQILDWENVMGSCSFIHKYLIFRKSYFNENSGSRLVNMNKSKYDALLRVYGNQTRGGSSHLIKLLIDNDKIVEMQNDINPSNWSNEEAGFLWNTHLE